MLPLVLTFPEASNRCSPPRVLFFVFTALSSVSFSCINFRKHTVVSLSVKPFVSFPLFKTFPKVTILLFLHSKGKTAITPLKLNVFIIWIDTNDILVSFKFVLL